MTAPLDWNSGRCVALVTGASRGLGRHIALQLARRLQRPDSGLLLLTSRSLAGLEETRSLALEVSPALQCHVLSLDDDRPDAEALRRFLLDALSRAGWRASDVGVALAVHNAGSLGGHGRRVRDMAELAELQQYFTANLFSVVLYNNVFLGLFDGDGDGDEEGAKKQRQVFVVNISSLCALQPFATWSLYCTGKASRDMLFRTLAEEEKESGRGVVRALSYAPGPLDTDMVHKDILGSQASTDAGVRSSFVEMRDGGKLLKPEDSAERLVNILTENKFESGAHVDYFD